MRSRAWPYGQRSPSKLIDTTLGPARSLPLPDRVQGTTSTQWPPLPPPWWWQLFWQALRCSSILSIAAWWRAASSWWHLGSCLSQSCSACTCRCCSSFLASFAACAHSETQFAASVAASFGTSTLSVTLLHVTTVAASATVATANRTHRTRGERLSRSCMVSFLLEDGPARRSGRSGASDRALHNETNPCHCHLFDGVLRPRPAAGHL